MNEIIKDAKLYFDKLLLAILYDMNIVNYSQTKLESC